VNTWLEQVKQESEKRRKQSSMAAELQNKLMESRRKRSESHRRQLAYIDSFVPLEHQIQRWWNGLSDDLKHRPFSTMELVVQLRGRYKERPAASAVATALRKLGFVQYRDWTSSGQGRRLWKVPFITNKELNCKLRTF